MNGRPFPYWTIPLFFPVVWLIWLWVQGIFLPPSDYGLVVEPTSFNLEAAPGGRDRQTLTILILGKAEAAVIYSISVVKTDSADKPWVVWLDEQKKTEKLQEKLYPGIPKTHTLIFTPALYEKPGNLDKYMIEVRYVDSFTRLQVLQFPVQATVETSTVNVEPDWLVFRAAPGVPDAKEFILANDGSTDLTYSAAFKPKNLSPSCNPGFRLDSGSVLPKNESRQIKATLDPPDLAPTCLGASWPKEIYGEIIVTHSRETSPPQAITVLSEVRPRTFTVEPQTLREFHAAPGGRDRQALTLTNQGEKAVEYTTALEFSTPPGCDSGFTIDPSSGNLEPGQSKVITVALEPPEAGDIPKSCLKDIPFPIKIIGTLKVSHNAELNPIPRFLLTGAVEISKWEVNRREPLEKFHSVRPDAGGSPWVAGEFQVDSSPTGTRGLILRSRDEGKNWESYVHADSQILRFIDLTPRGDSFHKFVIGEKADGKASILRISDTTDIQVEPVMFDRDELRDLPKLNAVDYITANEGWMVGNQGTIVHYMPDVSQWKLETCVGAEATDFLVVRAVSATLIWVAGADGMVCLSKDRGTQWNRVTDPSMEGLDFSDIESVSSYAFLVGERRPDGKGVALRADKDDSSGIWKWLPPVAMPLPIGMLHGVTRFKDTEIWAVGENGIVSYNKIWVPNFAPVRDFSMHHIRHDFSRYIWAVGETLKPDGSVDNGLILKRDSTQ